MWQKISSYITAVFIFAVLLLTGCSGGGASNQPGLSADGLSHRPAQPMTAGPMPQHIALLLPITGALSQQANAVRNGFFAAYYQDKQQGSAPLVKVYDTSHGNITAIYQEAIQEGANFVVGPLTKEDLSQLVNAKALSVPTLALNTLDADNSRIANLYQFGLSPIDEAMQAAKKIEMDGHHRVIIIRQAGDWSNRIVDAFAKQWQADGGHVVEQFTFASISDLNNGIPRLLNIEDAQHRAKFLQYVVREKIRFIPRRRKDFDSIFLVAMPDQARQVLPLLRFYYAGGVPVYATSLIYSGKPGTSTDYDLSGVMFDDMPWVLQANANLPANLADIRQGIRTLWPTSYDQLQRLYALGVDAYQIIPNLDKLSNTSQNSLIGATGQLYLLPNQHLYRQLEWAKIVNGAPELESP